MAGCSTDERQRLYRLEGQLRTVLEIEIPRLTARNRGLEERIDAAEELLGRLRAEVAQLRNDNAPTRPDNEIPEPYVEPFVLVEYLPYEGDDEETKPDNRW